jgi:hypothetical protein
MFAALFGGSAQDFLERMSAFSVLTTDHQRSPDHWPRR